MMNQINKRGLANIPRDFGVGFGKYIEMLVPQTYYLPYNILCILFERGGEGEMTMDMNYLASK